MKKESAKFIMANLRLLSVLLFMGVAAHAQRPMTVAEVTAFVKSQIKMKGDDRATADFLLHRVKLTDKLEDRAVEELQGQGAGPKTVQALRKLSEESASLPAAPPPAVPPPPPPPTPPPDSIEQAETLAAMKEYALNYTRSLPNYLCVQTTRRHIDPTVSGYRPYGDVVQEQLTFFDGKETYKVEMIDGKSVANIDHNQLGGAVSSGEFGTMLAHIFGPETGAEFDWDHWGTLRGKRMYVFSYRVPKSAGYSMYHGESKREYVSAYKGLVYAEHDTKAVMRITMETVGIPADYPIHEVGITLDYNPSKIGDQEFVLPFHFELNSREDKAVMKNAADYKLYRKFGAEATITFGDTEPIPEDQLKEQPNPGQKDKQPPKTPTQP
jgi:hypothetical protein